MSKYDPLRDMLLQIPPNVSEKTLTFSETESILDFKLPGSAYNHRPWWANPSLPNDHPYAQSWLTAGWKVDTVNQNQQWVRFIKVADLKRYSKTLGELPRKPFAQPSSQIASLPVKIVIQCAGSKFENAGRLTTLSGEKVLFAVHPERYTLQGKCCRPDDIREGTDSSWRAYLESYNQQGSNANHLFPAGELAKAPIYKALIRKFAATNVFILSAGWGLVRSDYLLPYYDITFSNQGKPYSKRRPSDRFKDFNQLSDVGIQPDETIYFFGGQSYLPLYLKLTRNITARKVIYHSHGAAIQIQGYICIPSPYPGSLNWHYKCAQGFINGMIQK
jgi:hypothetical protein